MALTLAKRYFSLLIVAYLIFIGIASFYFSGEVGSLDTAMDQAFFSRADFRFSLHNLRDISTNILLYMPLGFVVALRLACNENPYPFSIHVCWGVVVSIVVETIQAFIGRFSDITDVFSNGTGYVVGFLIAQMSIRMFALSPLALLGMSLDRGDDRLNNIAGIRFIYLAITFLTSVLPFNLTVSLTDIFGKLTALDGEMPRLILNPFYHLQNSMEFVHYLTLNSMSFVPLAYLSSYIQIRQREVSLLLPAWHCLCFSIAVELANVFVRSGRSDIFIPLLGFGVGTIVSYMMIRFSLASHRDLHLNEIANRHNLLLSSVVLYLVFVLVVTLSPFEFETSIGQIRSKILADSNFVPFMAHFSSRSTAAAIDIVREVLLYVPFGALFSAVVRTSSLVSPKLIIWLAAFLGGTYAIFMELLQLLVVGRLVDLTDVLLATVGSIFGVVISPLFIAKNINS